MKEVEVYYFSGTGNSLHVAKELAKRIPGTRLLPIVRLLNQAVVKTGETVGFVFPVYYMTIPTVVSRFLKKLDLAAANYVFAVATRGGTPTTAFDEIEKRLNRAGKHLDACFVLNMADNNPRFKNSVVASREDVARMEAGVLTELDVAQKVISDRDRHRVPDSTATVHVHPLLARFAGQLALLGEIGPSDSFYADSKCTGCGTCERLCLSGKVRMAGGRPVWDDKVRCYTCRACLNYCPAQAVQIESTFFMKSYTDQHGRYFHPDVTPDEIAAQK